MFTKKNLIILIGRHALIASSVVIITVVIVSTLAYQIKNISNDVIKSRALTMATEKRIELLTTLNRDTQLVGNNATVIDHAFISSDNILDFISNLEKIAIKNATTQGYHFDNPAPAGITAPFPLSTVNYQNTLAFSSPSFISYLKDLEGLPYFTKITNFNITSQDKLGWLGASSISFNAVLYTKTAQ